MDSIIILIIYLIYLCIQFNPVNSFRWTSCKRLWGIQKLNLTPATEYNYLDCKEYKYILEDPVPNRDAPMKSSLLKFDSEATNFAEELLSSSPVCLDNGLQATNLSICFGFDKHDSRSTSLITRNNTRNVYNAVFDSIMAGKKKFLVEGAPGIGKSRNLIYLLKLLLEVNKIVMFHSSDLNRIYVFVPPQDMLNVRTTSDVQGKLGYLSRYKCFAITDYQFRKTNDYSILKSNPDVCLLFDPSVGHEEPVFMSGTIVIAASPNDKHFKYFNRKYCPFEYKINAPSLEEVITFFRIEYPLATTKFASAPPADYEGSTFNTPVGLILADHYNHPLSDQHLKIAYYEIGGSFRFLQSWYTVIHGIYYRNDALRNIMFNFEAYNSFLPGQKYGDSSSAIRVLTSYLCVYHNEADPNVYHPYCASTVVKPASQALLQLFQSFGSELIKSNVEEKIRKFIDRFRR